MTLLAPLEDRQVTRALEPGMRWKANHTGGWLRVHGGRRAVRLLVGAIDGDGWPWTTIERADSRRWFQVLGTPECCLLELGGDHPPAQAVYRPALTGDHGWIALPPECAHWIGAIRSDEALTVNDAATLGLDWLNGTSPGSPWRLREAQMSTNREQA